MVVLGDPAPPLQGRAQHRVPGVAGDVQDRAQLRDLGGLHPLRVDPVELVGEHPPPGVAHLLFGVCEVEHAALAEQEVVLQLGGQLLPEVQRVVVERRALVEEVVGADDRGVAGHVAAGQPAALKHRDIADAVVARQVVSRRQAVSAGPDDHHLVMPFRVRVAPQPRGRLGQDGTWWGHFSLRNDQG